MDKILEIIGKWEPQQQLLLASMLVVVFFVLSVLFGIWLLNFWRLNFEALAALRHGQPADPVPPKLPLTVVKGSPASMVLRRVHDLVRRPPETVPADEVVDLDPPKKESDA